MRRRAADDAGSSEQGSTRLAAIEQQLEQLDANLQAQLESLNTRLEEVWESEEQLSHLADIQEKLDRLAEQQFNLSLSVASLKSTLGWLAALVVVAAGAEIALKFFL
jgi:chromosome segregation ATPase